MNMMEGTTRDGGSEQSMLGAAGVAAGPFDDLADATSGGAGIETPTAKGPLARFDRATDSFKRPSEHRGFYLGPAGEETC